MRRLTLNDDDLIINDDILMEADYIVELEAGETIADFDRIQNLTNEEILDELDYEDAPYSLHEETLEEQGYSDYDDMGSIDSDNVVFVRFIDLVEHLDEDQLNECAFFSNQPGGFAYEIVDRDSDKSVLTRSDLFNLPQVPLIRNFPDLFSFLLIENLGTKNSSE